MDVAGGTTVLVDRVVSKSSPIGDAQVPDQVCVLQTLKIDH